MRDAAGWPRRAVACAALATALAAALAVTGAVGGGQATAQVDRQAAGPSLDVVALPAVVRAGDEVAFRVAVENPGDAALEGAAVELVVSERTRSRSDHRASLEADADERRTLARLRQDVAPVAPGGETGALLEASAAELGLGGLATRGEGVHPVRIALTDADGAVLDEVRTSLVALSPAVGEPLRLGLVLGVAGEFSAAVEGVVEGDPLGGRLGDPAAEAADPGRDAVDASAADPLPGMVAALAGAPRLPLTVAADAVIVEQARAAADGYTAADAAGPYLVTPADPPAQRAEDLVADLSAVLARPGVDHLALPYAQADLVALTRAGAAEEATRAITVGATRADAATGARPLPGVLVPPDGLDERTLRAAVAAGVERVLLRTDELTGAGGSDDAALRSRSPVRRLRTAPGPPVTALVADPWPSEVLGTGAVGRGAADPEVVAQHILADTAALYFERPFDERVRGSLVAPPPAAAADPAVLAALLDAVADAPWLRPVGIEDLATEVTPEEEPVELAYPPAARLREHDRRLLDAIAAARAGLATLQGALPDPSVADADDRLLLLAASTTLRDDVPTATALVAEVAADVAAVRSSVTVLRGPQITLTRRDDNVLPVTLRNNGALPLRVQVSMTSPSYRFEGAVEVTLAAGELRTLGFRAHALRPGATAPVTVEVRDGDGEQLLAPPVDLSVRSTAYSRAAVAIAAASGLGLAVWWVRDAQRRRRARAALAVRVVAPGTTPTAV